MDCKYIKALAVVSALCFMSGFIAYRVGAFDHYFVQPPAPVEPSPEPAADPALMSGSKYIALPPAGSAPASVSPPSVMGGSKSVTLPTVILPGSKVEAIVKPTVIMPGPKSMPVIGEKK